MPADMLTSDESPKSECVGSVVRGIETSSLDVSLA